MDSAAGASAGVGPKISKASRSRFSDHREVDGLPGRLLRRPLYIEPNGWRVTMSRNVEPLHVGRAATSDGDSSALPPMAPNSITLTCVLNGELALCFDSGESACLMPGDSVHVPTGLPHRLLELSDDYECIEVYATGPFRPG